MPAIPGYVKLFAAIFLCAFSIAIVSAHAFEVANNDLLSWQTLSGAIFDDILIDSEGITVMHSEVPRKVTPQRTPTTPSTTQRGAESSSRQVCCACCVGIAVVLSLCACDRSRFTFALLLFDNLQRSDGLKSLSEILFGDIAQLERDLIAAERAAGLCAYVLCFVLICRFGVVLCSHALSFHSQKTAPRL